MIYQSNLEEFYRVRIGILTHRFMLEPDKRDPLSGMLPDELMEEVLRITREQQSLAESVWKAIRAELRHSGVEVLSFNKISKVDELMSKKLFGDIRNLLFPKIISLNQPFPFLWGEESYVIAFLGRGRLPAPAAEEGEDSGVGGGKGHAKRRRLPLPDCGQGGSAAEDLHHALQAQARGPRARPDLRQAQRCLPCASHQEAARARADGLFGEHPL